MDDNQDNSPRSAPSRRISERASSKLREFRAKSGPAVQELKGSLRSLFSRYRKFSFGSMLDVDEDDGDNPPNKLRLINLHGKTKLEERGSWLPKSNAVFEALWELQIDGHDEPHAWSTQFELKDIINVVSHLHKLYGHGTSKFSHIIKQKLVERRPWKLQRGDSGSRTSKRRTFAASLVWLLWVTVTLLFSTTMVLFLTKTIHYGVVQPSFDLEVLQPFLDENQDIVMDVFFPGFFFDGSALPDWARGLFRFDGKRISVTEHLLVSLEWTVSLSLAVALFAATTMLLKVIPTLLLPAKILLENPKTHESTIRKTLEEIAENPTYLSSMTVVDFLGIGVATFSGISSTVYEGKAFIHCHDKEEWFALQQQPRTVSCCCFQCTCSCRMGFQRYSYPKRWAVLTLDGIVLFRDPQSSEPSEMLLFDTNFSFFRRHLRSGRQGVEAHKSEPVDTHQAVFVVGATWVLELRLPDERRTELWTKKLNWVAQHSSSAKEHRHGSSFAVRGDAKGVLVDDVDTADWATSSYGEWFIGGKQTFWEQTKAMAAARHEIYITDWFLTPHVRLIRLPAGHDNEELFSSMPEEVMDALETESDGTQSVRLSKLLKIKADQGVRVCINVYEEHLVALPNNSAYALRELGCLSPNIHVLRHRALGQLSTDSYWSHHEKLVVVDQLVAFVGGIDLALMRYDDMDHTLVDPDAQTWKGKDYINIRVRDFYEVDNETQDMYDRSKVPRMPWQDIQSKVYGTPARDVAKHFVLRWNYTRSLKSPLEAANLPVLIMFNESVLENSLLAPRPTIPLAELEGKPGWPTAASGTAPTRMQCQVLRSIGRWSAGTKLEASVHTAYLDMIYSAQEFIYIENQYFASGLHGDEKVGNRVADALLSRIIQAHQENKPFHVMIVLPLVPGFEGEFSRSGNLSLMNVMEHQYHALSKGENSIMGQMRAFGINRIEDYLSVYGLRTHDMLNGKPVTELIYVHSKLMIVDDARAIIGSANINDRSMLGMRDSEVCILFEDPAPVGADGSPGFSKGLRESIIGKYLGCESQEELHDLGAPNSQSYIEHARAVAKRNTDIYEDVFGVLPSDSVASWADLEKRRAELRKCPAPATPDVTKHIPDEEIPAVKLKLDQVKGQLVTFPMNFLGEEEDIGPLGFHVEQLLPMDLIN